MQAGQILFSFLGRFFVGIFFILSAMNKIFDWQGAENVFVTALCDWHMYVSYWGAVQDCFSELLGSASIVLGVVTAIELFGGICLLFGAFQKFSLFLLLMVLLFTMLLLHPFFFLENMKREVEMQIFVQDLAILGGLLFMFANTAAKKASPKPPSK